MIDLADTMPPEVLERLHGAVRSLREVTGTGTGTASAPAADGFPDEFGVPRPDTPWWDPASDAGFDPGQDRIVVDGRSLGAGSRVLLRPGCAAPTHRTCSWRAVRRRSRPCCTTWTAECTWP